MNAVDQGLFSRLGAVLTVPILGVFLARASAKQNYIGGRREEFGALDREECLAVLLNTDVSHPSAVCSRPKLGRTSPSVQCDLLWRWFACMYTESK